MFVVQPQLHVWISAKPSSVQSDSKQKYYSKRWITGAYSRMDQKQYLIPEVLLERIKELLSKGHEERDKQMEVLLMLDAIMLLQNPPLTGSSPQNPGGDPSESGELNPASSTRLGYRFN